jgi:hypothetical protein
MNIEQEIREINRKLDILLGTKPTEQPAPQGSFAARRAALLKEVERKGALKR